MVDSGSEKVSGMKEDSGSSSFLFGYVWALFAFLEMVIAD